MDRRRRIGCSPHDKGPAMMADLDHRETGAVLRWRLEHCGQERPMCRETRWLRGNCELSAIRLGRWRIGQPIDRCHNDKHNEQPRQEPVRLAPCCSGWMHQVQDSNKLRLGNPSTVVTLRPSGVACACARRIPKPDSLRERQSADSQSSISEHSYAPNRKFRFEHWQGFHKRAHIVRSNHQIRITKQNERRPFRFLCGKNRPKVGVRRDEDTIFPGGDVEDFLVWCRLHVVLADVNSIVTGIPQEISQSRWQSVVD